jgi:hypothetical protein
MMSDPFFSQLLLVGLLWRYLMRSVVWPDPTTPPLATVAQRCFYDPHMQVKKQLSRPKRD